MKKVTSIRIEEKILKDFQHKYFGLMSEYINRALIFGLKSNENFQAVFFGTVLKTEEGEING